MVERDEQTSNQTKAATAARAIARPRGDVEQSETAVSEKWWAGQDLNLRPIRYERTALTS